MSAELGRIATEEEPNGQAIFLPLVSFKRFRRLMFATSVLLIVCAVALSDSLIDRSQVLTLIYHEAVRIPMIADTLRLHSVRYPGSYAISHLLALALGFTFGVLACFTRLRLARVDVMLARQSRIWRVGLFAMAVLLPLMLTVIPEGQWTRESISVLYFNAVGQHRELLALNSVCIFVLVTMSVVWIFFEIANLLWRQRV